MADRPKSEERAEAIPSKVTPLQWMVRGTLALLVSVAALWWALRDVSLVELGRRLAGTDFFVFGIYLSSSLIFQGARVVRWGLLILPIKRVSHRAIASAALIGLPAAALLPLRLGELVRPIMIARSGVPFASGMASVVVERVADGLVNVGLFFFLLAIMPASAPMPDELRTLGKGAFLVFGAACFGLIVAVVALNTADRIVRALLRPISESLAERVSMLLHTFVDGVRPLAKPSRLFAFLALTAIYWGINGAVTTLLARSYGLDLPFIAGPFAITCVVFAIMVPAGPAFAGTLQAGMKLGLAPFGVTSADAAVVAISAHIGMLLSLGISAFLGFLIADKPGSGAESGSD